MQRQHKQVRLLMALVYMAFAFAYRIMMIPPGVNDSHLPDLTGDLMMNYDIVSEIIGAKSILDGSFSMYVGRYSRDIIPNGVVLPYPPLTAYLQTPIVYVGTRLGLDPFGMTMFMICGLPYIVLGALCALQAGYVLRKCLGVSDEMTITATVFLILFSSLMFWVVTYAARFEYVAALFLLLAMSALGSNRYGLAGICLGLSLMTKQLALPAVMAFVIVALFGALRKEIELRKAFLLLVTIPIPFVMLVPFYIASPEGVREGMLKTPSLFPIMHVSFVNLCAQVGKLVFEERAVGEFLKLHSNSIILLLCVGYILAVVKSKRLRMDSSRFCALAGLASFLLVILTKYTYIDKYSVPASVFVILWGASRKPGFPYDALWFVVLQSFILDHVPVIWKQYVGLIFYSMVFAYVHYMAFTGSDNKLTIADSREPPPEVVGP
ncbi:hypothetical protein HZA56_15895 [Candidatus Poribacteria bacterium]|nr:hypothetical protein [Candidatus Poribacteria bacterium]